MKWLIAQIRDAKVEWKDEEWVLIKLSVYSEKCFVQITDVENQLFSEILKCMRKIVLTRLLSVKIIVEQ